ncbi:MAG: glycosyltransferase family 4 protein, partial [Candidatus Brocadiia bacterium]|nr:glycosyltransferase family 4 protein [Candidatus Brocadiia bacterium]
GGHAQMPWRFIRSLGLRNGLFYTIRNVLNALQMRTSARVRRAAKRADVLIAATEADRRAMSRIHRKEAVLKHEQGAASLQHSHDRRPPLSPNRPFRLGWCGRFLPGKQIPIALRAVAIASRTVALELNIIGDGRQRVAWQRLSRQIGVERISRWWGKVEHDRALEVIADNDCMLLTTLQEATTTVVFEALASGLPVICHDSCGFASVVDDSCGIKIPVVTPRRSVEGFAKAIVTLGKDPEFLARLSAGAFARAAEHSWDNKAREMVFMYRQALSSGRATCRAGSA